MSAFLTGNIIGPQGTYFAGYCLSRKDVLNHLAQAGVGFGYFAAAIDGDESSRDLVVVEYRSCLGLVFFQTVTDDFFGVVATV